MTRREFITILGGTAAAGWPLAARAQQVAMPLGGFLRSTSANASIDLVAALRRGLAEAGYTEGQNIAIDYRWAENRNERLAALAADLVRRQCALIVAGGDAAAHAAKAATATIPIVFATGDDPVKVGLVAGLNRPGGNITGISFFNSAELESKQLELLREVVPKAGVIAVLVNPSATAAESQEREAQIAARALGLQLFVVNASSERDFCCGVADTVKTKFKVEPGDERYPEDRWYAWIKDEWLAIPSEEIVQDYAPDGQAYLFMLSDTVQCFVRPKGGL
jgi:putative tryptophan/tyrosine transport system substrate-binding protein